MNSLAKETAKRWSDPSSLSQMNDQLHSLLVHKQPARNCDLRGLIVGLSGTPLGTLNVGFARAEAEECDFSFSRFSCGFGFARILKSRFASASFEACLFKAAKFEACIFDGATFRDPFLNDASFLDCSFVGTKLFGKGFKEFGGRRVVFECCNFDAASFQNLQLRACKFRDCTFEGATFKKCLLVGLNFDGSKPTESAFVACQS